MNDEYLPEIKISCILQYVIEENHKRNGNNDFQRPKNQKMSFHS